MNKFNNKVINIKTIATGCSGCGKLVVTSCIVGEHPGKIYCPNCYIPGGRNTRKVSQGKTSIYRHFDSDNNLLYIGISLSTLSRLGQHKSNSSWFDSISRIEIEKCKTRSEAFVLEKKYIKEESPVYNVMHSEIKSEQRENAEEKWENIG